MEAQKPFNFHNSSQLILQWIDFAIHKKKGEKQQKHKREAILFDCAHSNNPNPNPNFKKKEEKALKKPSKLFSLFNPPWFELDAHSIGHIKNRF